MFCILYCNKKKKIKYIFFFLKLWKPDFFADPQARRRGPQFENHCCRGQRREQKAQWEFTVMVADVETDVA